MPAAAAGQPLLADLRLGMFVSLAASGEPFEIAPVEMMATTAIIKLAIAICLLAALDPGATVSGTLTCAPATSRP